MKRELDYFRIEDAYGGYQNWFKDFMMKIGGCAAVTACDCCIYFDLYKNCNLYPYDKSNLSKADYIRFSEVMKPYLRPRLSGIDTLDIYIDGLNKYFRDKNETRIKIEPFAGSNDVDEAISKVIQQIDDGFLIPYLVLKHRNSDFKDYVWHWFLLAGYEYLAGRFMVKVVTYGTFRWMDFRALCDTGYKRKGGMILYSI